MTRIVAAGMPASGKSTFIAALTHLLTADQVRTELRLTRLSVNEAHLSQLEQAWLQVKKLERTKTSSEQWVSFHVADTGTGVETELLVPDLRGELFSQPATVGRCQRQLWEALVDCDGLLLFTNANARVDDMMVEELNILVEAVAGVECVDMAGGASAVPAKGGVPVAKFRADDMPEETKLVELLQAMNRPPFRRKRRRVGVVISAWDVVSDQTPSGWLSSKRPMLSQFLKHNDSLWDIRTYGVSAQGGSLPADQDMLRSVRRPGERVQLVGIEVGPHDLTSIVKWVAQIEGASNA